jgi:multiple sugar transport system substrate-binding protein
MNTIGRRRRTPDRPARGHPAAGRWRPARAWTRLRAARARPVIGLAVAALAAAGLTACGTAGASTGPVTLNLYLYPDSSGATQQAINNCDKQSGGKYTISYQQLPTGADGQRQQMARRLAAHDGSLDILGLDVTWEAEFAQAGWIEPWTGAYRAQAVNGTLRPALQTAIWKGRLYAVPDNSNTQLLWYRSDLVPHPPTTWAQMLADAAQLKRQGKPHLIEIQGAQYEGTTVWFNTMVSSAGGTILDPTATKVTLGAPAVKALSIMKQLASGPGADPSLSVQMENDNRLAMEGGTAAFQLNYPFVYPAMKADNPKLFKVFKWALYPEVIPGVPAKVTIGGIDLAVSAYSQHKALAFQAALCLRDRQNQIIGANVGGVPPTITSLYNDPALFKNYPFHADILNALEHASVRPKTPVYQVVSIDISHLVSPPSGISPASTEQSMASQINNALQSKGLVP